MIDVVVFSRSQCCEVEHRDAKHIFVSISTPHDPAGPARLRTNALTLGVLQLQFYDADRAWAKDSSGNAVRVVSEDYELDMFHPRHARAVLAFVDAHPNAERVVVHCDAGLSRSPGVAAALAYVYNGDDAYFFKRHSGLNRRAYRMILEERLGPSHGGDDNGDDHHRGEGG
jgi:predicted protein tyrosine phosphatase